MDNYPILRHKFLNFRYKIAKMEKSFLRIKVDKSLLLSLGPPDYYPHPWPHALTLLLSLLNNWKTGIIYSFIWNWPSCMPVCLLKGTVMTVQDLSE